MASLIRPLNRCLMGLRQANNFGLVSVIQSQQRFKSKDVQDSLDKPFNKNKVSDPNADPKESYLADPWDILYGNEKFEVAMKNKGYNDPYDSEPAVLKKVSTRADPNIVSSLESERVIACVCEPDTHHVNYTMIHMGETKRCECGHWFKCVPRELPDLSEYGITDRHVH